MSDETPSKDRPASPERPGDGPPTAVPAPAPPADDDSARDGEEPGPAGDSAPASRPAGDDGETGTPATGGSVPLGDVSSIEDAPDRSGGEIEPARPVVTTTPGAAVPAGDHAPDPAHDIEQRKREAGVNQRFPFGRPGQPLGNAHPFVFGFTGALGVITAWLLVRAAVNAQSVIIMIVVAMFLAVGLNPAVERLKRVGLSRGWAVAVVFLGVLLFFAGFVASLVPPLTEQITALTRNVPQYIQQLQSNPKIADWDRRYQLLQQAQNKINDPSFQEALAKRAYDVGKVALSGTFQTLTILILTLYFLGSLPQIKTFFYQLAPRSRRARVALLGDEILNRIGGYVAGQFTIAFICGLTTYIFLEILGVPYALALALIVAVTDLIPLIGATIGAVIVTFVAFLTGVPEGIASLVFYVIYQQVENYLVYPRVMKRTVDVQPAVTVVAALVGGALLGVIGALLAIPTAAAISLVIREVFMPRQESL
ncbi:AI-2E family transporter [Actinomadura viridis]|uniref:PurR-regulated permease PerM n=1 Tax=Actinomadura viridis TaxID=58110 RepID=A0A931DGB2_9ACTN|nr:AI-2E family transporter [Actinomadura viridis]MBG6086966.1 putative PurR-regulated permease PerM [Actinomadura viridis]